MTLQVSDSGPGVPDDIIASIFEARVSSKGDGRGLGLATVKGIVDEMQGGILVRSAPGEGATFKLFFPACQAGSAEPVRAPEPAPPEPLSGRVLYYAGETQLRRVLGDMLGRLGLEAEETAHPRELLSMLGSGPRRFDAVVVDVTHKSEQDILLGAIGAINPDLNVLIISDLPAGDLLLGNSYGPPGAILQKPFELRGLAETLRRLISAPST